MKSGGNLIKVVGSNIEVHNSVIKSNKLNRRLGGIQVINSYLELNNNTFDMN